jgi:hypothetical protein
VPHPFGSSPHQAEQLQAFRTGERAQPEKAAQMSKDNKSNNPNNPLETDQPNGQSDKAQPEDKVGYRRPPKHSRFKKGKSGNPRGRPKAKMSLADLLEHELQRPITVEEEGERRRMTRKEAIANRAIRRAIAGDFSLLTALIAMIPKLQSVGVADGRAAGETARERIAKKLEKISELFAKKNSPPDEDNSGRTSA